MELINFETALIAKLKKFNLSTLRHFDFIGTNCSGTIPLNWNMSLEQIYSRPTQSELQTWLREYDIYVVPSINHFGDITLEILYKEADDKYYDYPELIPITYKSYEEALEIGLQYGLGLVETK